jgi:hypothetical protein
MPEKHSTEQSSWKSSEKRDPGPAQIRREHEVRLPDRFWRHGTKLSAEAKALYAILLTFTDYNTAETRVGNSRLEKESGYGRDKVEALLRELERSAFINRDRQYRGNLKSERTIKCLKFVSMPWKSGGRPDALISRSSENQGYILTESKSSEPSQSHKSNTSIPLPESGTPERIM